MAMNIHFYMIDDQRPTLKDINFSVNHMNDKHDDGNKYSFHWIDENGKAHEDLPKYDPIPFSVCDKTFKNNLSAVIERFNDDDRYVFLVDLTLTEEEINKARDDIANFSANFRAVFAAATMMYLEQVKKDTGKKITVKAFSMKETFLPRDSWKKAMPDDFNKDYFEDISFVHSIEATLAYENLTKREVLLDGVK